MWPRTKTSACTGPKRQHGNTWASRGLKCAACAANTATPNRLRAPESLAGADGPEPAWLVSPDLPAQVADVADAVARLAHGGVPMSEIAVLYVRSRGEGTASLPEALLHAIEARGALARWAARDAASKRSFDITTDSVTVSTIHSAKGLDFAHVFLLGLDSLNPEKSQARRLAHVGMTRARERLTLAVCGRTGWGSIKNRIGSRP